MKAAIHPQYNPNTKIKCACGKQWTIGSTMSDASISICSNCHPFYTGHEKILDAQGRVEKFKKRMEKSTNRAIKKK